jgi:hypothetical protein
MPARCERPHGGALRRHGYQFPPDQLKALVFGKDTLADHALDLGDREAAALKALAGLGRPRERDGAELLVHGTLIPPSHGICRFSTEHFVFELTGRTSKIKQFIAIMTELGLVEVARTGIAAISRGPKGM